MVKYEFCVILAYLILTKYIMDVIQFMISVARTPGQCRPPPPKILRVAPKALNRAYNPCPLHQKYMPGRFGNPPGPITQDMAVRFCPPAPKIWYI